MNKHAIHRFKFVIASVAKQSRATHWIAASLALLAMTITVAPIHAQGEHATSAIMFAQREDWDNAKAQANASGDSALIKLIDWEYLLSDDGTANFDEYTNFIEENPDWPEQKKLRLRAELSLHKSNVDDRSVLDWFNQQKPMTGVGKIALAEAMARTGGNKETIRALIHDAWRNGDFDEPQEKKLLEKYGDQLTREDHIARIDRLLWDERVTAAQRILRLVPEGHQKLFKARIGLIQDRRIAILFVAQVPSVLKNDPGLIYDRMRYRARHDDDKGVRELLLAAPARVPFPEKWWKQREYQIRTAIDEKNYALAGKLLANHGQEDPHELADALWLEGWLNTEFLGHPKEGLTYFEEMMNAVKYPVSKARAAYWAGRAAEKMNDQKSAERWYSKAAEYPTAFYGQLSALKINPDAPLHINASPSVSSEAREAFFHSDLAHAITLAIELGQRDIASRMVTWLAENGDSDDQAALVSELGNRASQTYLSVRAAKKALTRGMVLGYGYPLIPTPANSPLERALTLAITRQESEFDPMAKSPSGALGMMQLLPKTAKEIAKKNDLNFAASHLTDPNYNMTLGSLYLARLISGYSGSYVMAIAAYNAGPGNVHDWAKQFGTPGTSVEDAVDWIEKVPFHETRNYVQRVMENMEVYRHLEVDSDTDRLKLAEDLVK